MCMVCNFSVQLGSPTGINVKPSRKSNNSSPDKNDLLMQLKKLQIKNDSVKSGILLKTYNESSLKPTSSSSSKKGVIIVGNNQKKAPVTASFPASESKKNVPGTPKQPFSPGLSSHSPRSKLTPKGEINRTPMPPHSPRSKPTPPTEYARNLPGTPKSSHSPRTKLTPTTEFRKHLPGTPKSSPRTKLTPTTEFRKNLAGTPKSSHSPRSKMTPKGEYGRNFAGTPKSTPSPRNKIIHKTEYRRHLPGTPKSSPLPRSKMTSKEEYNRNMTGASKSTPSPRNKLSPKALPQLSPKSVPIVQVKQKKLRAAFESLNSSNYNKVKMQIVQSNICLDTQLPKCVNVIFLKSMENPKQIPLYVRMCKDISKSSQKNDQFQLHMTNKCKSEVAQFREQARPNEIKNRKSLTHRALPLGTFIGELYKAELLTWSTITGLMQSLVNSNWISEGSVGLICNLINSLGKSYKRDCGNNFILSGIGMLEDKCNAKSFSKSTCAKIQKLKELHQCNQTNIIVINHEKPSQVEQPFASNISVDNFDETLAQLKEISRISEEEFKANVKKIFIEGIAELSTAPVSAKFLKNCYYEKSYSVKKEIQYLINEELKDVRKDLLALQDSKHGENSKMELKVGNLTMFIAELYKVGLVPHDVVFNHLQRLNDAHFRNEISMKLSCDLLRYIGAKLEKDTSKKIIKAYIKRLGENIKQFGSDVGDSIREVKELQLNNWQSRNLIVNKLEYSQVPELISDTQQDEYMPPTEETNETETSNENVTNVVRDFLQNAKSSKELMSKIKALMSPENINEVTIECFCQFVIIAIDENVEYLNVDDLYECFEKLQSILRLSKCNVISLCPRISSLIEDVLIMRGNF
ncbi:unnamed protein product [Diamesa serratosioi]